MRLNKSDFLFVSLMVFIGGLQVAATKTNQVDHFNPGSYELVEGHADECGGQNIKITDDGMDLAIEPYHYFRTSNELDGFKEGACSYKMRNSAKNFSNRSVLTYQEDVICEDGYGVGYNQLVKSAIVRRNKIHMVFEEDGGKGASYRCTWKLKDK